MNDSASRAKQQIESSYAQRTRKSAALSDAARHYLPSGVVHVSRYTRPHGLYANHALGSRKWDIDGNEYIDYFGGHGALLLGHNHPRVIAAASAQLARGTHFAAGHELDIRWAEKICEMIPGAERVRFHSSGTEATQMAVRLARAFTGKNKLMRFHGHYHGWLDDMTSGYISHFDGSAPIGVPANVAANSVVADPYDKAQVERLLNEDTDIAAVIVEPLGAATGKLPIGADFLRQLRDWTAQAGVLLIFDEVVTGFRVSPGGLQTQIDITPDLTALAKIVAGGLPGGAVTGRADILAGLDYDPGKRGRREKIFHPGTFNACPVSAAAGLETLNIIQQDDACERASRAAAQLREGLADSLRKLDLDWVVYGEASAFHIYMGGAISEGDGFDPQRLGREQLYRQPPDVARLLRLALNINGVDFSGWPGGLVSTAHSEADIDATVAAFAASLELLRPVLPG
ncbi:MAG: aminotransferase class III-fold pyridoxal phosphate-dependent enzyme [Gammaproteobacteria bacterium]|nr:aminotransferase class III-fold pyridoxal phosphate-dependent enzyme [Gammaproteobacteria bacterium]